MASLLCKFLRHYFMTFFSYFYFLSCTKISVFFWEKLVYEKGMDKIPFFFNQIKSNRVSNPNADEKFRTELVKSDVTNDFLDYFDQNRKYLIKSE